MRLYRCVLIPVLGVCLAGAAWCGTRRALLVGINRYIEPKSRAPVVWQPTAQRPVPVAGEFRPRVLPSLEGPVADVYAMRDLLVERYGFQKTSRDLARRDQDDIQIPLNENATADRILSLLKSHLIDKAKAGDIGPFYFAGHGSRIYNGRSEKPGKLDVTLVPADHALGVPAIRDKELARIYRLVPKGVSLTVIQDNCYSGGGARGGPVLRSRDLPDDTRTVADPPDEVNGKRLAYPDQQENPVLVMAASRPDQVPLEASVPEGGVHGLFTYALVKTLREAAARERVDVIFQKVRANMGMDRQEPAVSGRGRLDRDLFGQEAIPASRVAAIVRSPRRAVGAGWGSGIRNPRELRAEKRPGGGRPSRAEAAGHQTHDLNLSTAEVIGGRSADEVRLATGSWWKVSQRDRVRDFAYICHRRRFPPRN